MRPLRSGALTAFTPRLNWHYIRRTYACSAVTPRPRRARLCQSCEQLMYPHETNRLPIGLETTIPVVQEQQRGEGRLLASYLSGLRSSAAQTKGCDCPVRATLQETLRLLPWPRTTSTLSGHAVRAKFEAAPRRNRGTAKFSSAAGQPASRKNHPRRP